MLEVFEIYQPPQADRNKIAGKMLGHILIVFAALAVVMVKLFLCIGADSARNRDAVRKVTSPETEQWALIVLLVFVAAVIYLSVAGFLLSRKVRRQFTAWVYNGEKLYVVTAKVPSAGRYSSPRRVSSVFQIQERALEILHDPRMLVSLIEGTVSEPLFRVTPVTEVRRIRQREQVHFFFFLKTAFAASWFLLEWPAVEFLQFLPDCLIQIAQGEKCGVSQGSGNPSGYKANRPLGRGFVFWVTYSGWQDTSVVMFRHLLVGRIENDFPFSMAGDAGF